ncbi:MAG: ATP-dependent helicase [Actinomycetales bacterium]|nr:ATP-dependent helicase [Actinomycetales bacterium]
MTELGALPRRATGDGFAPAGSEDATADWDALRAAPGEPEETGLQSAGSIWPHVDRAIVEEVLAHRSTIVFANSRRLAERLTASMNDIYEEMITGEEPVRFPALAVGGSGITGRRTLEASADRANGEKAFSSDADERTNSPLAGARGASAGADERALVLARAHHGSVSKEQRAQIEDDLKSGRLRCVVATSSLELGIDMGAVDLVIQVEAPPSVASALQRVGRAGHQVGETSQGVLFPKHRADLLHVAVATERMRAGLIEELRVPTNPLDILAQQTVAAVALDRLEVDDWFETVRRSAPFATLPRSAFEATLDLLAGRYPSDEFAELRPRLVWDRVAGTIEGRPGAQRLAVTSGGTIPDRGMFGVYLVGAADGARRVGELDEEMVYESRVGDVFALGATSWRIEEITSDRVLVTPAFGQPGRVPFWKGDGLGRPAELGEAIGAFTAEIASAAADDRGIRARLEAAGLDAFAVENLVRFVHEQKAATGVVPTDQTLLVERFRDELGDWRLVLHSPYGLPVHAPWALAVQARIRERLGVDGSAMAGDDGIVVRLPETDAEPPGADLFLFERDELTQLVTEEAGGSALFASRFREAAARALLMPRYNPGRRTPLWQQRQRSAQLLEVARKYPQFPILLETLREVLQDVYDLPALDALTERIAARRVRVLEVESASPSPFARTLLFGYVAAFLYEGDSPLAERRAAALSLDPTLLAELLGRAELRELLDPEVIAQTERELQRLDPERHARDAEGLVDLLRLLGPQSTEELAARFTPRDTPTPPPTHSPREASFSSAHTAPEAAETDASRASAGVEAVAPQMAELARSNRVIRASIAGAERWAVVEDASRLRDALGVPLPIGVPTAFLEPVADPVGDLVSRYARTHGPFTTAEAAARLGLGVAVVQDALRRLASDRRVQEGEFRPGATGSEWVDAEVLRRLRARSLAALRSEVEPVPHAALGRFLPDWQHVTGRGLRGVDGLVSAIDQLAGVPLPASAWETLVLPARVRDYHPGMLDELTATGEVLWSGHGELSGGDGWVALHLADTAAVTLPEASLVEHGELHGRIVDALAGGGAFFARQLQQALALDPTAPAAPLDDAELGRALWELVWAGLVSNDTLAPLRARLGGVTRARAASPGSRGTGRAAAARWARGRVAARLAETAPPTLAGRWSLLPAPESVGTLRATALAEQLLERHGVVTRGAVQAEDVAGGFATAYRVLSSLEETGRTRRGYFVEGLGAAQFATPATIDRLRSFAPERSERPGEQENPPLAVTLAATDPANPFGAALGWPAPEGEADATARHGGHRPGRKAGALVTLVEGRLAFYLEKGGKTLLDFLHPDDSEGRASAAAALAATIRAAGMRVRLDKADGAFPLGTPLGETLVAAGFTPTPQGLRLRG